MFVIAEIILPENLTRIERLAGKPDPMLTAIGAYMKATTQEAFATQGRPANSWRPRAIPNIAGILRDFHEGRPEPVADRFLGRPALVDSGDLKGSIDFDVNGNAVTVGSNLPYAVHHQFGAEAVETLPITAEFQEWLTAFMLKQERKIRRDFGGEAGDLVREQMSGDLGWLTNPDLVGEPWEIDIPPRPFLDVLPEDEDNIREIAFDFLTGVSVG